MTAIDRRTLSSPILSGSRLLAALAGVALTASIALLLRRMAPGAPGMVAIGLAGVPGLSVAALAFVREEEALPKLTQSVLAAVALIIFGAFVEPAARLRLSSFASLAFAIGLAVWLERFAFDFTHILRF